MFLVPHGPSIAPKCPTAVIADKIKHIYFQQESKKLCLLTISVLPLCRQSTFLTPYHAGRGLAGHPRCVSVGNDYGKTRLYSSICSKTTALPQYARHHSTQRGRASPPFRGDESAGKRSHRNRSSSPERVRLLQPLLSRPQNKTAACDLF